MTTTTAAMAATSGLRRRCRLPAVAAALLVLSLPASAQEEGPPAPPGEPGPDAPRETVTLLRALDKVTARITELRLPEDEPVAFGTLVLTARHCYARPPEEPPETFAFLEIDDVQDGERERVFTGWMMASSPALHALEHPVYDVWVVGCERREVEGATAAE